MRNTPCGEVARRFLEARRSRSYIPEVSTRRVEHEEFGGSRGQFQGNGTDNGRVLEMLIRERGGERAASKNELGGESVIKNG